MYEAKTKLSEVVDRARREGEVILMNRGVPVARVVPFVEPVRAHRLGFAKGKIRVLLGFDRIPEEF